MLHDLNCVMACSPLLLQVPSFVLSSEAKDAAAEIERRLQLGSKLSEIVNSREDALSLFSLYKDEGYILSEHMGKFCVSNLSPSSWIFLYV